MIAQRHSPFQGLFGKQNFPGASSF